MDMTTVVGWASLLAGILCLLMALYLAFTSQDEREAVKKAVEEAAKKAEGATKQKDGTFEQQAGAISTSLEAVATLAASLKDLDRVAQLLTVSLGFFAIAAVAAGLEGVAKAVAG